jgi:hypothetical protein
MIDLGCVDMVILNTPYFNKNKLNISNIIDYSVLDFGVSGNSEGGEFRANQLILGNNEISNPVLSFSKDTAGALANSKYDGLLGNGLLDKFNYAIDYKNHLLYLNNNKRTTQQYKTTVSGLYVIKQNNIGIVKCIYKQFEPFKQGINIGDTIVKINNQSISSYTQKDIDDMLNSENKNIIIQVKKYNKLKTITYNAEKKI